MEKRKGFRVDKEGNLRFENDVICGSVVQDVDGYYKWAPSLRGGIWEGYALIAVGELLNEMNAEWDEQIRVEFEK